MSNLSQSEIFKKSLLKSAQKSKSVKSVLTGINRLKVVFLYDEILLRYTEPDGSYKYKFKDINELEEELNADVLFICKKTGTDISNNSFVTYSFGKINEEMSTILNENIRTEGIEEYFEILYNEFNKRYEGHEYVFNCTFEEPYYTIRPKFIALEESEIKELFRKYLNSYIRFIKKYIDKSDDKADFSLVYGTAFKKALYLNKRVALWVTPEEDAEEDEFRDIKVKIISQLKDNSSPNVELSPSIKKYMKYFNPQSSRINKIDYKLKFKKSPEYKNKRVWETVDCVLLESNGIRQISDLVDFLK